MSIVKKITERIERRDWYVFKIFNGSRWPDKE
jgi:hypothetical protein